MKKEQILLWPTPIQYLEQTVDGQDIFIKRDDLLGFSFGGNKCRIGQAFLEDMKKKGKDFMISYGSPSSNLNRTIAALCKSRGIPCLVLVSEEENISSEEKRQTCESFNSQIVCSMGIRKVVCKKQQVAQRVEQIVEQVCKEGYHPYYIYGNQYGTGNEETAREAYQKAYGEIRRWEEMEDIFFDSIFLASGTGMTQGGLLAGKREMGGQEEIIGISVAREQKAGKAAVRRYAGEGTDEIIFDADFRCGGYGIYDSSIETVIKQMMENHGIALDPTYTGKAYAGMLKWLKQYGQTQKKVLFIHTGGLPLYFDYLNQQRKVEEL